MKHKVCFVESASSMGGVEFSTLYLAQHLNRTNWEPVVICPTEGDLPKACRQTGVPVIILPVLPLRSTSLRLGLEQRIPNPFAWAWNLVALIINAVRLRRFLRHNPNTLVVTKGLTAHFYGGIASILAGIPCIWHVQDFISERFGGLYRRFFGLLARWIPNHIIVDGTPIAHQLPQSIQKRVTVVFNGVDTKIFRPRLDGTPVRQELEIPLDALVIGNVARLTPWKGQHYLLEAFARLAPEFPNTWLLLVGSPIFESDEYEHRLRSKTQQLGLDKRVIFAGYRRDLPQVLAAMDIFAFTSVEKDTSPLALVSAMSMGLPIVASDIEGVRDIMQHTEGLFVPPAAPEALANGLASLLSDATLRQRLGHAVRERVKRELSLENYVQKCEQVFQMISRETLL